MANNENGRKSKRDRKPTQVYEPEVEIYRPRQKRKLSELSIYKHLKNLNFAARESEKINKWTKYKSIVKRSTDLLVRQIHFLDAISLKDSRRVSANHMQQANETEKSEKKIYDAKKAILATLYAIDSENSDHKRWPQLSEADEDGMVDLDEVLCSRCNKAEEEGNDILLCDREGCLRAYHQNCLEPPITTANMDPEQDWFCWQCECLDDCLEYIGDRLDMDVNDWQQLFPEVSISEVTRNTDKPIGDTLTGAVLAEDEDDEEEDEYTPGAEALEDEGEEEEEEGIDEERENTEGNVAGEPDDNQERTAEDNDDDEEMDDDDEEEIDDDSFTGSGLDSNLEDDEVAGLLQEADIDYEVLEPTRKLRPRVDKAAKHAAEIEATKLNHSDTDINREVAKVRRGVIILGKIIAYHNQSTPKSSSSSSAEAASSDSSEPQIKNTSSTAEDSTVAVNNSTTEASAEADSSEVWTVEFSDGSQKEYDEAQIRYLL